MARFRIRSGNQMIAEGAIAAGCRFFAGYPITPASGIYKSMIDELTGRGDVAISAPDEILALSFCVGASLRGFKAMTATSGPGFSLMIETLQYAVMTETPVVIALVQRLGPSTGGATQGGQGDALLVGHAIGGGYTIPVFSPSNPLEAYELTLHAFNVAEKFRTPVVLMTDKEVGMTSENIDYEMLPKGEIVCRTNFSSGSDQGSSHQNDGEDFKTYLFEKGYDPPDFAPIGGNEKVTATGSAHDMAGRLQKNSPETIDVLKHLQEKISFNADKMIKLDSDLVDEADTIIMSYGISARTSKEAVADLRKKGERVSFFNLQTLFPIPENRIRDAAAGTRKVVVVEENMTGLYKSQIEKLFVDKEVLGVNEIGRMIRPDEIEKAVLSKH